jgi:hypothetical protein
LNIDDLLHETVASAESFWFVQDFQVVERTDSTITFRLSVGNELFIQIYLSERSGRFSMALVGLSGRLYGRDREHGRWHRQPFGQTDFHEPTPEGMSPRPVFQFLAEVEEILLAQGLI